MTIPNNRIIYIGIFLFTVAMIGIAMYMEHVMYLEPCPLCIMQRIFFIATGVVTLIAAIHNPKMVGKKVYGLTGAFMAIAGSGFAIRQIYLQHLPEDQIPQCLPSVGYMLEMEFPMRDVLELLLKGDGNCAEVVWVDPIIGLGIPQWSLVGFAMLAGVCLYQAFRK